MGSGHADALNKGSLGTAGETMGWLNSTDVYCPLLRARDLRFLGAQVTNSVKPVAGLTVSASAAAFSRGVPRVA